MKIMYKIGLIIIGIMIGYFVFHKEYIDSNYKMEYGSSGFPSNCRAIIYENYRGYSSKEYSAEDALESINRNCGKDGYSR